VTEIKTVWYLIANILDTILIAQIPEALPCLFFSFWQLKVNRMRYVDTQNSSPLVNVNRSLWTHFSLCQMTVEYHTEIDTQKSWHGAFYIMKEMTSSHLERLF
jgi:hypothetical protein